MKKSAYIIFLCMSLWISNLFFLSPAHAQNTRGHVQYVETKWEKTVLDVWVRATYILTFVDEHPAENYYDIDVGCYYEFQGRALLYSDDFYLNGQYIGTFTSGNGWHNAGTIYRSEQFRVRIVGGVTNEFSFVGDAQGVGGTGKTTVYLPVLDTAPSVQGQDSTWVSGDIASGLRTWESLYTDGATGSAYGNKQQTAKGFVYYDAEEAPNGMGAYDGGFADQSRIVKIVDKTRGITYSGNDCFTGFQTMNEVGQYDVYSGIYDAGGLYGEGMRTITVQANTPPQIQASDRWFFVEDDITPAILLNPVKADDAEDGDLSEQVQIKDNKVIPHQAGDYEVTFTVEDTHHASVEKTILVHIIDGDNTIDKKQYLRFISPNYMDTLKTDSLWRTIPYEPILHTTLNKQSDQEAIQIWSLDQETIAQIKAFNETHDFSKESNDAFYARFAHLIK